MGLTLLPACQSEAVSKRGLKTFKAEDYTVYWKVAERVDLTTS